MAAIGRTIAENLEHVAGNREQDVVRLADKPRSLTGVAGLKGDLAVEGAIVKVAGTGRLRFTGPARCFDSEQPLFEAIGSARDGAFVCPDDAAEAVTYANI
jgi:dihydroxy-acid dehydratase